MDKLVDKYNGHKNHLKKKLSYHSSLSKDNTQHLIRYQTPDKLYNRQEKKKVDLEKFKMHIIKQINANKTSDNFKNLQIEWKKLKKNPFYLKQYQPLQLIGRGSFGTVMKVQKENKLYAIKTYEKVKMSQTSLKSTREQIAILQKIKHQGIIQLLNVIQNHKAIHLIMQFFQGSSLQQHIKQKGGLNESECRQIFKRIVMVIEYLHNNNIAHRDIKTQNILINSSLDIKIIDFGFATQIHHQKKSTLFCGTPSYMAPQIILRKPYCPISADIWSLGILLYYILVGVHAFRGSSQILLYKKIMKGQYEKKNNIGEGARYLISKMLVQKQIRATIKQVLFCKQIKQDTWLNPIDIKQKLQSLRKKISLQ